MLSFLTSAGFVPSFLAVWTHVYDVAPEFVFQRPMLAPGPQSAQTGIITDPFTQLNLTAVFDVKAAASNSSDSSANFDSYGRSYPAKLLPNSSDYSFRGIEFALPSFHSSSNDALRSAGQVLNLSTAESRQYHSLHILGAVTFAPGASAVPSVANFTFHYDDGETYDATIILAPWFSPGAVFEGAIYLPYHYANPSLDSNQTIDKNNTHIHYATARIPSARNLTALTLPPSSTNIHIFAITLVQASAPDNTVATPGPARVAQIQQKTQNSDSRSWTVAWGMC
ncbi:hypothetical protein EWM64_g5637 [Hericium alpestre]|uniref:Glycoside hydrolase 131 catalytic N-terminal domain-containing protein n=1 Tax=Hericium alpestre TaxID=135208 RepID=A0A4Y9ZWT0_9AGAM|nr:hypothetical protein EWM64_g5637 [Hericium alpestre]